MRGVLALAVAAVSLPSLHTSPAPTLTILAVYVVSNLVLLLEKPASFLRRLPEALLFIFDLGVIVTLMLLAGEGRSQFYVTFFLIILMAALARSARAAAAIAVVSAALYAFLVGIGQPEEMLQADFTTRVALFFVTALFSGYLAEEAQEKQDRLRRVQGFYRTIFDESADGVLVLGSDGLVRETNSRAVEMLGDDPTGQPANRILGLSDTHIRRVIGNGRAPAPKEAPLPLFTVNLRTTGNAEAPCEVIVKRFAVEGEDYKLFLLRDVQQVLRLQKRMAELERTSALGDLVGSITHEINNPLTAILGYSELLMNGCTDPELRGHADQVHQAGKRCKEVVETILGRYRSRSSSSSSGPVRVADLVRNVTRHLEFHMRYHLVTLDVEAEEGILVRANEGQLEQVMTNLMCNAVKAMRQRPDRLLRVRCRAEAGSAVIEVSDTGCGIAPEHLKRLFERGFSAWEGDGGHGLGLALSREIVEHYGGKIEVRSEPGQGTTFTLRLPLLPAPPLNGPSPA